MKHKADPVSAPALSESGPSREADNAPEGGPLPFGYDRYIVRGATSVFSRGALRFPVENHEVILPSAEPWVIEMIGAGLIEKKQGAK